MKVADIPMEAILSLVGVPTSNFKGDNGYIQCPICKKKRTLNINLSKGVFRCLRCDDIFGGKLDFYALFSNNWYQSDRRDTAWIEIKEALGYGDSSNGKKKSSSKTNYIKFQEFKAMQKRQSELAEAEKTHSKRSCKEIDYVYRSLLQILTLEEDHKQNLLNRGLTNSEIDQYMYRSVPQENRVEIAKQLLDQGICLNDIPGFFINSDGDWCIYTPEPGFFVPIYNNNLILGMQVRLEDKYLDRLKEKALRVSKRTGEKFKEPKRFRYFTSSNSNFKEGTKAEAAIHVEVGSEAPKYVCITEGALKAQVAASLYRRMYGKDDIIYIAVPGVTMTKTIPHILDSVYTSYRERLAQIAMHRMWTAERKEREFLA